MPGLKSVIETKAYAAPIGGGLGLALSEAALWTLGVTVWHASNAAQDAATAVAAVPTPVAGLVSLLLTSGVAFLAAYLAPHTSRTDTAPPDAAPAAVAAQQAAPEAPPAVMVNPATAPATATSTPGTSMQPGGFVAAAGHMDTTLAAPPASAKL